MSHAEKKLSRKHGTDDLAAELVRLKAELRQVRTDIVQCAPAAAREKLLGYCSCADQNELSEWQQSVVECVIGLAQPIPKASSFEERANCPLCGSGGHSPYAPGYKLPGGLELHLQGGQRARPCHVMEAAWCLALQAVASK
jgi:hypothetical protein